MNAALGYATGLVTGDGEAGAVAGLTGALVTDLLFDPSAEALDLAGQVNAGTLTEADMARALWDWQSQGMDLARLSAALAAFAAGADADGVRNAGDIGNNVAENNALETVWDLASLALSLNELGIAIENGDTLDIILAGGAVVIDGIAVALPGAPGGAGAALSVSRETGDVVLTQVDDAGRAVETTLGNVNDLRTGAGSRNGGNGGAGGNSYSQNKTGTVWDDIVPTQDVYPGSVIPRSFELGTGSGQPVWVHGNATEHLAEYAQSLARNYPPDVVRVRMQQQIRSMQAAVDQVTTGGVRYDELINVGGWELKFSPPREPGQLPALIHALPTQ